MILLEKKFLRASKQIWKLGYRPTDAQLLKLYALYKQATNGDIMIRKPWSGGLKEIAKWNARSKIKGMLKEDAMKYYIELVMELGT